MAAPIDNGQEGMEYEEKKPQQYVPPENPNYNPDNPTGIYDPSSIVNSMNSNKHYWSDSSNFSSELDTTKKAGLRGNITDSTDNLGNPLPATAYEYIMQRIDAAKKNGPLDKWKLRSIENGAKAYYNLDKSFDISGQGIWNSDRWMAESLNRGGSGSSTTKQKPVATTKDESKSQTPSVDTAKQTPVATTKTSTSTPSTKVSNNTTTTTTTTSTQPKIDNTVYRNTNKEILNKLSQTYPEGNIKELELNMGLTRDNIINYLWNEANAKYGNDPSKLDSKIDYISSIFGQLMENRQLVTTYADKINKSIQDNTQALNKSKVDMNSVSTAELNARNGNHIQPQVKDPHRMAEENIKNEQQNKQQTKQNMATLSKSAGGSDADTLRQRAVETSRQRQKQESIDSVTHIINSTSPNDTDLSRAALFSDKLLKQSNVPQNKIDMIRRYRDTNKIVIKYY